MKLWDDVQLPQSYGRRAPSGGHIAEKGRRVEDHAKWTTKTTNIVDEKVDMFAIGVLVLEVITSRRAVDTTEAMSALAVNVCYFQDHTAPSYLNELIRHGQLLME
ncbi:hypothetical protein HID58_064988 [Brassica napus]|uniref:Serine-threonine/tyrosine-protein kinase catalytic domain-containing protein n=1 Tax=Brassica napus TaxID=3708 RepID=A0ABQ7ZBI1_BRANA|nr:hypothetical protein HID58_064988 [Brassica napus]